MSYNRPHLQIFRFQYYAELVNTTVDPNEMVRGLLLVNFPFFGIIR